MEPAKIDWKNIDSKFVEDKLYEHINAPKWFDFLAPYEHSVDDDAWFCRPDCNHPKTAQDFLRSTPSKLSSTHDVSEIPPLGDRTQREAKLKRRGLLTHIWVSPNSNSKFNESSENQNPNLSTPPNYNHVNTMKAAIKSSTEKKEPIDDASQNNEALPMLKHTLSAKNLFAGRDILNQITEFCSELKRLATRSKERENVERLNVRKSVEEGMKEELKKEEIKGEVLGELNWRDRERKPFLEINHNKSQGIDKSSVKEKKRMINKNDNAENIPISVNLEYVKRKGEEKLLQIRTNPPSPQCFSATSVPAGKTTPSKVSKSKLMERDILQEQNKKTNEEHIDKGKSLPMVDGREARTLDVFWFLKPCTLST